MPIIKCSILRARTSLCKTFRNDTKEPYPNVKDFKSTISTISDIEQFAALIKRTSAEGACLLKGELDRELNWESRAGHTDPNKATSWICLDLDYLSSIGTIDDFLAKIGGTDVSYVLQWSASYGIHNNFFLRAHLFMLLDQPQVPAVLKNWLKQVNLQNFATDLSLTKANTAALRWGLDITTCQSDKLLYVAPPNCYPSSINHFTGERIILVKKDKDVFTLPPILPLERLRTLEETKVNELLKAAGMDPRQARSFKLKELNGEPYLPNPGRADVTGEKIDGEFVRLNLNGGDSWGYYYLKDKPELIRNFKGEPLYRTQELLPDYWYSLDRAKKDVIKEQHKGKIFLAFRDFRTRVYYNGWYDEAEDKLTLHPAADARQINDFLVNYGQPVPDSIPILNIVYNPLAPALDLPNRQINMFRPSLYMQQTPHKPDHQPFPTIDKLCRHVIGPSCLRHWYNWLAFLYQKREAPSTAWVLHGVQGTGKGVLYSHVLQPLFGNDNVTQRRMEELEDRFNDHLEHLLLCFIDEAQVSNSGRSKIIMANIKNQITEPEITIRRMRTSGYTVKNHSGWIFATNMPDAVIVDPNDRRFNVAEYQKRSLAEVYDTELLVPALADELLDFATFLQHFEVDIKAVRTPLINDAKAQLILESAQSADIVAQAINAGQLAPLWDALPFADHPVWANNREEDAYFAFKKLVFAHVIERRDYLTRDDLFAIFSFCVGNTPVSPHKLTSYLRHHGIELKKIRIGARTTKGLHVEWKDSDAWFTEMRAEVLRAETPTLKVVPPATKP